MINCFKKVKKEHILIGVGSALALGLALSISSAGNAVASRIVHAHAVMHHKPAEATKKVAHAPIGARVATAGGDEAGACQRAAP